MTEQRAKNYRDSSLMIRSQNKLNAMNTEKALKSINKQNLTAIAEDFQKRLVGSMKVLKGDTSYQGNMRHERLAEPGDVDKIFPDGTTQTDLLFQKKFVNQLQDALKIGPDLKRIVETGMPMISPYHVPQGAQGWI